MQNITINMTAQTARLFADALVAVGATLDEVLVSDFATLRRYSALRADPSVGAALVKARDNAETLRAVAVCLTDALEQGAGRVSLCQLGEALEEPVEPSESVCSSCGGWGDHGVEEDTGCLLVCYGCGGSGKSPAEVQS